MGGLPSSLWCPPSAPELSNPAHLPLKGCHAGRVHHQAPVAIGVGGVLAHQASAEADNIEGPNQVNL